MGLELVHDTRDGFGVDCASIPQHLGHIADGLIVPGQSSSKVVREWEKSVRRERKRERDI